MSTIPNSKLGDKSKKYNWGKNFKENILHFFFQLIRDSELIDLEYHLYKMLLTAEQNMNLYKNELITLYKIIGYTRDIRDGRGERMLAYMQIWIWYMFYPDLAFFALTQFVYGEKYGSWKDIKYFCAYIVEKSNNESHPLIEHACNLMVMQLKYDIKNFDNKNNIRLSLVAKWTPREKTRFRWLYTKLAIKIYPHFLETALTDTSREKAKCKAKINLRKKLSKINRYISTTEYIMCNEKWENINYEKLSAQTLWKYKLAFQNKTTKNVTRHNNRDRYICAAKLQYYIDSSSIEGCSLSLGEFVKAALNCTTELDKQIINQLWKADCLKNSYLENFIPIIDVSSSLERNHSEPLYNALGLGIRLSEILLKPFKNRVMLFSASPTWVAFSENESFVDKVVKLKGLVQGLNSNIIAVLKILIKTFIESKISKKELHNLTLVIFSDMQMDTFPNSPSLCLYDNIKQIFLRSSLHTIPKILFWNVRKTMDFPVKMYHDNVILLSGNNAKLFNTLTTKRKNIKSHIPLQSDNILAYSMMLKHLNKRRYKILYNKIISKI